MSHLSIAEIIDDDGSNDAGDDYNDFHDDCD